MPNKFGSVYQQIVAKTADYTVQDGDDLILVDASGGAVTITLPTPLGRYPCAGRNVGDVMIVKTDTSSYPVKIAAASGSIVGQSALRQQNQSARFISDGIANWYNFAPIQAVFAAEVSLTSAQVKALRATPITMVQAQGAGTVIEFLGAVLLLDYGSNVFTESTANLSFKYNNGSGVAVSDTVESTGFIDQSADTATQAVPIKDAIVAKTGNENKAIVLHNIGAGEIAGNAANDSALRVKVLFSVHNTGW
jgi:hypothetical protein